MPLPALPAPDAAPQRLYDIGARHGTDKAEQREAGQRELLHVYEEYFEPLRTTDLVLVEIGVLGGASLRMWREYFPRAQIFGIDVDPETEAHTDDRIAVLIGSQSDTRFLDAVLERTGRPDIVLDDGSHFARDQITTLLHLWRHVMPGAFTSAETNWADEPAHLMRLQVGGSSHPRPDHERRGWRHRTMSACRRGSH